MKLLFTCYAKRLTYVLIFCSSILSSQKKQDTILASKLIVEGDSLIDKRELQNGVLKYTKASEIYAIGNHWKKVAKCFNRIASAYDKARMYDNSYTKANEALSILQKNNIANSSEQGASFFLIAKYMANKEVNFEKAMEFYNKSLEVRRKTLEINDPLIAQTLNSMGIACSRTGRYKKAISYYKKAIEVLKDNTDQKKGIQKAEVYGNLGLNYNAMGEFEQSLEYQQKSIALDIVKNGQNSLGVAYAYMNMSVTYQNLLEISKAIYYNEKALPILLQNLSDVHPDVAIVYENLGVQYHKNGLPQKGLEFAEKALKISNSFFGENHPKSAFVLNTIGMIYNQINEPEKALEFTRKALEISRVAFGENHMRVGSIYTDLGLYYRHAGYFDMALENDEKALEVYKTVYGENHPVVAGMFKNVGLDYQELGKDSIALHYFEKALKLNFDLKPISYPKIAECYTIIGDFYHKKKNHAKANNYFEKALVTLKKNTSENLTGNDFANGNTFFKIYGQQGKGYFDSYVATGSRKELERSLIEFGHMDSIVDAMRNHFRDYEDQIHFSGLIQESYHNAIAANLLSKDEDQGKENAFYYAEKSRFNVLRELLNSHLINGFSGLPEDILAYERDLKTKRAYYSSKIANSESNTMGSNNNALDAHHDKLFNINRSYDSLLGIIRTKYPDYFAFKHNNKVLSLDDVKRKIPKNTTLIEYVQVADFSYVFVVTKDSVFTKKLNTVNLNTSIVDFTDAIKANDLTKYKELGHVLYKMVLAPIEDKLNTDALIIIPDGLLWNLNFELLLSKFDTSNNPKELSYLLKDYAISYANSATLLFGNSKTNDDTLKECLAFSFTGEANENAGEPLRFSALRDTNEDLPGTRREIKEISKIVDGNYYYGNEAVEANFKEQAHKYAILHLALHGNVDDDNPSNSRLLFTQNNDSLQDNYLYTHELFAMELPADLAVLSACETGIGKLTSGEGIMSLGNAFQYAGTKSLLLSGWKVSDNTAPKLMGYFYENLTKGMTKSKALQQAKLSYLETSNLNRSAPFYWGSFYLVGDIAPIQLSKDNMLLYVAIAALSLFLLGFFYIRFKRNQKGKIG